MLPISLRVVYALNSATFQVSSLALLSIVNTRVGVGVEYLPALGAISFLPYSLLPIFAWVGSLLLKQKKNTNPDDNKNRHDKLLFPAFLLASSAFVGTVFIPPGGVVLCFVWGFLRGVAGAWTDFLIGMSVIEFSKLQSRFLPSLSQNDGNTVTYEKCVSVNTAQSSTARNIGSFVASVVALLFFSKNRNLSDRVANTLILGTAAIFLLASFASLKYQSSVEKILQNSRYDTIIDNDEEELTDEPSSTSLSSRQSEVGHNELEDSEGSNPPKDMDMQVPKGTHRQQIVQVSTLISFQALLAVSALQKPIISISSQTTWLSLVVTFTVILVCTIFVGYRCGQQKTATSSTSDTHSSMPNCQHHQRLPHGQLNLYFLLRYSMPITGFLMYSYIYTVFQSEPMFLQLLAVLKSAIGSISTFFYEKVLSPKCHSGWPLIGMIFTLDIVMGLVALLDVWVVRAVSEKVVDGEYYIDTSLRCLVGAVGLAKYFFAELDYMPTLVLSTTNIYNGDDDDLRSSKFGHDGVKRESSADSDNGEHVEENQMPEVSCLNIDSCNNEEETRPPKTVSVPNNIPVISAGMQYASFLSCIDFGAQIGDWITVPIVASLGIARENNWDCLDQFVIICSVLRMARVVFLWLICPPMH